jgi:hypothetical protein
MHAFRVRENFHAPANLALNRLLFSWSHVKIERKESERQLEPRKRLLKESKRLHQHAKQQKN